MTSVPGAGITTSFRRRSLWQALILTAPKDLYNALLMKSRATVAVAHPAVFGRSGVAPGHAGAPSCFDLTGQLAILDAGIRIAPCNVLNAAQAALISCTFCRGGSPQDESIASEQVVCRAEALLGHFLKAVRLDCSMKQMS